MTTNLFSLEGKNAWITGASYGIGFNIAKAFVAAGIKNIIFNDINAMNNLVWISFTNSSRVLGKGPVLFPGSELE